LSLTNLSTKRQRIAELARTKRGVALSTLHHVIDLEWMQEAYRLTRKDGAPGIDGVTADDYAINLEANLLDLLDRIKSGRYQAPPVRRIYIPKADGSRRPLGIPTIRDRVVPLLLHRSGLAPPTPCRSPGALRVLHAQPGSRVSISYHVNPAQNGAVPPRDNMPSPGRS
jgi:hypothetical protein